MNILNSKYSLMAIGLFIGTSLFAQSLQESLNYTHSNPFGTARFQATGGAFGALGADMSALDINPAGSSFFIRDNITFSLDLFNRNNTATWENRAPNSLKENNFSFGQFGASYVFKNNNPEDLISKIVLGFNYHTMANYNQKISVKRNSNNSIANYYTDLANGIELNLLNPKNNESIDNLYAYLGENYNNTFQTSMLAYQAYIFDAKQPKNDKNTAYISNAKGNNFNQRYNSETTGYRSKATGNFSMELKEKYYIGMNINSHYINHNKDISFNETNNDNTSKITNISSKNNISVEGIGISFQLGIIAKFNNNLRAGISYQSPIWYDMNESSYQSLSTRNKFSSNGYSVLKPNVVNNYPEYSLRIPAKYGLSFAYVGTQGFISFDFSTQNLANIQYNSDTAQNYYNTINNYTKNNLGWMSTYALGGEYKVKSWSFRGGYTFQNTPHNNKEFMSDIKTYSVGLGYTYRNIRLDFAYSKRYYDNQNNTEFGNNTPAIYIKNNNNFYCLTTSFSL